MPTFPKSFKLSKQVQATRQKGQAIVALESTVITHGLPREQNFQLARNLEEIVRAEGATPATVAVLDGRICVGLDDAQLVQLATFKDPQKMSSRDLAAAIA